MCICIQTFHTPFSKIRKIRKLFLQVYAQLLYKSGMNINLDNFFLILEYFCHFKEFFFKKNLLTNYRQQNWPGDRLKDSNPVIQKWYFLGTLISRFYLTNSTFTIQFEIFTKILAKRALVKLTQCLCKLLLNIYVRLHSKLQCLHYNNNRNYDNTI